ncbi:hypothetical protein [Streptomyces sp. MP131-18]|uniref:hypothetical protein n=1 Tax=Streptomyces sp. MP131-18 TaxID=1857892 RepID=UPI00097C579F|nr:hypothetical protein [Streptomyces sp. MP131-18]ONK16100.1 hypothetical protein STBA_69500 [Streptomyces sp. MP131-18]
MIGRRRFVATTASGTGLSLTGAATGSGGAAAAAQGAARDRTFLGLVTAEADGLVPEVLSSYRDELADISARRTARSLRRLAAAWAWQDSAHHRDEALLGPMAEMAEALAAHQHDDGLFDQGNLHSPPDTAFSIADLCLVLGLLGGGDETRAEDVRITLSRIVRAAGPPIAEGGVHTPNHRWKVCAVLAQINALFPDGRYPRRIDQWLAEGIDQYPGGQYSERSATYAAVVTGPSLLTVARLCDRPELYEHVRRNLAATLYQIEPNGEVVTVHSRRQDQTRQRSLADYWLLYRALALRDGNGRFAAVARDVERRIAELPAAEDPPGDALARVLDDPELARQLPPSEPPPTRYTHHDTDVRLVRLRRGSRTITLFGGTDFPDVRAISSGLSTNPTFLSFRRGAAILDSVRLAPQFFSLGHFRSEDLQPAGGGWRLHARVRAAYHLPLPPQHRRRDGDYPLTDDGRFWSAMDFPHRPRTYVTLRTEVLVEEAGEGLNVSFEVDESEVPLAIELVFRPGGELGGAGLAAVEGQPDTYQLTSGEGSYRRGDDRITFGPGNGAGPGQPAVVDPGERYTWLNGSLTPPGPRVLITGRAPFRYRLRLR